MRARGSRRESARKVWFPKGSDWYDMALHTVHRGGSVKTLRYAIDENPWYVKAGSIIPLASTKIKSLQEASNVLGILIVPGKGQSSFTLYEDDGTSRDYDSACARTLISKSGSGSKIKVTIGPRDGSYEGMPENREIYLTLEGVSKLPKSVKCNGVSAGECRVEGSRLVITLPAVSASARTTVEVSL